jgi:hypothetical protein
MSWIGTIVSDLLEEGKRNVRYEGRRIARRTASGYIGRVKNKVVSSIKRKVDTFCEKHPTRANTKAKNETILTAEKVAEEIKKEVEQNIKPSPSTCATENVRRIEL